MIRMDINRKESGWYFDDALVDCGALSRYSLRFDGNGGNAFSVYSSAMMSRYTAGCNVFSIHCNLRFIDFIQQRLCGFI